MRIVIGSRGSDLALWQANFVKDQLTELGHEIEIKIITTKGDRIQDIGFDKMEGKGFFTKEIEEALLNHEIDLAVHSHKDLETTNPQGLTIGAVSYREDPRDMLLISKDSFDAERPLGLKKNAIIGTSSARRKTQLLRLVNEIQVNDLRGNVPTRIQKLKNGQYDAIVLAAAGVGRLKMDVSDLEILHLDPSVFVPAPAQGVLGLQIREQDEDLQDVLSTIHHQDIAEEIEIERQVLKRMEGGCQLPLGVYCVNNEGEYKVKVSFALNKDEVSVLSNYKGTSKEALIEKILAQLQREA